MISINKAILHILDFNSNLTVFSDQELDIGSSSVAPFLMKHVERSISDTGLKHGEFNAASQFKPQLIAYKKGEISFVELSVHIAGSMYDAIAKSDKLVSADIVVCDITVNEEWVIAILKCNNRIGFTHQVTQEEGGIRNNIINHYAILPGPSQKLDEYAFIGVDSFDIQFVDKKSFIDGRDVAILSDVVLECSSRISQKDAIGLVTSITHKVADSHGENSAIAVSKAKTFIIENTEVSEYLDPVELGKEVFASSDIMQQEYMQAVDLAGITSAIKIDKGLAVRTGKNHKIKTDTGIELSIPVDYFQNKDYVEFFNNPDGTLSIELKNIGKLLNK